MRLCCQCIVTPCGNVTSVSLQTCASGGKPWRRYTLHGPVLRSLHYILLAGIRTNVSVCNTKHILCDKADSALQAWPHVDLYITGMLRVWSGRGRDRLDNSRS